MIYTIDNNYEIYLTNKFDMNFIQGKNPSIQQYFQSEEETLQWSHELMQYYFGDNVQYLQFNITLNNEDDNQVDNYKLNKPYIIEIEETSHILKGIHKITLYDENNYYNYDCLFNNGQGYITVNLTNDINYILLNEVYTIDNIPYICFDKLEKYIIKRVD